MWWGRRFDSQIGLMIAHFSFSALSAAVRLDATAALAPEIV